MERVENEPLKARKTTFWNLIKDDDDSNDKVKKIVIPDYQREYAQGRKTDKVRSIREVFVKTLLQYICSDEQLEFDFIFGGSEKNGKDEFSPVDGQQRLTILFLLHWYIFKKTKKTKKLEKLGNNFRYETRDTSETFCKKICMEKFEIDFEVNTKDGKYNSEGSKLSKSITNQPWFTSAMHSDSTIKSMLVVLDEINASFGNKNLEDEKYDEIDKKLCSGVDDCPIYFYILDMEEALGKGSDIRDLYIKMNARGLPLTDFEIFKANLKKHESKKGETKEDEDDEFDVLAEVLGEYDSVERRIKIIGKFNTEYTNFFFKIIDKGDIKKQPKFDIAFMNFVNEIFRMKYFEAVSVAGIGTHTYRMQDKDIKKMSGKEFSIFIASCAKEIREEYEGKGGDKLDDNAVKHAMSVALREVIDVLNKVTENESIVSEEEIEEMNTPKCAYSFQEMLEGLTYDAKDEKDLKRGDWIARMGMYEFVKRFEFPKDVEEQKVWKKSFAIWRSFLYKIGKNEPNFDATNDVVSTFRGYELIVSGCKDYAVKSIYEQIYLYYESYRNEEKEEEKRKEQKQKAEERKYVFGQTTTVVQLKEEALKAKLIIEDKNEEWYYVIIEAENSFPSSGQIWFLLDLSRDNYDISIDDFFENKNTLDEVVSNYSINKFNNAKCLYDKMFDENQKTTMGTINVTLFDIALLVESNQGECHLECMSKGLTETRKFAGKDFIPHLKHVNYEGVNGQTDVDRYNVVIRLLRKMLEDFGDEIEDKNTRDIDEWLLCFIKEGISSGDVDSKEDWKQVFIRNYELIDGQLPNFKFQKGFEPDRFVDNDGRYYTALFSTPSHRYDSAELHSYELAVKLYERGYEIEYEARDNNSNPDDVKGEPYLDEHEFPTRYFTISVDGKDEDIGYKIDKIDDVGKFYRKDKMNGEPIRIGDEETLLDKYPPLHKKFFAVIDAENVYNPIIDNKDKDVISIGVFISNEKFEEEDSEYYIIEEGVEKLKNISDTKNYPKSQYYYGLDKARVGELKKDIGEIKMFLESKYHDKQNEIEEKYKGYESVLKNENRMDDLELKTKKYSTRAEAMDEIKKLLEEHEVKDIFAYNAAAADKKWLPELKEYKWHDIKEFAMYRQYNPYIPVDAELEGTGKAKKWGAETIKRYIDNDDSYEEVHNAYLDAKDELSIMKYLKYPVARYKTLT